MPKRVWIRWVGFRIHMEEYLQKYSGIFFFFGHICHHISSSVTSENSVSSKQKTERLFLSEVNNIFFLKIYQRLLDVIMFSQYCWNVAPVSRKTAKQWQLVSDVNSCRVTTTALCLLSSRPFRWPPQFLLRGEDACEWVTAYYQKASGI